MSTTYPYGLNTGSTIPGVEQTGYIVKGISNQDYSSDYGGVKWWMGPDEELGYVITAHFPGLIDGQDTPTSENARIRFWR